MSDLLNFINGPRENAKAIRDEPDMAEEKKQALLNSIIDDLAHASEEVTILLMTPQQMVDEIVRLRG